MARIVAWSGIVFAAACSGQPLPPDKIEYAGVWKGPGVELTIERDGSVAYDHRHGAGIVHVDGSILSWNGDDFVVGVLSMKTTVDVAAPPRQIGNTWTMNVDGVDLIRIEP